MRKQSFSYFPKYFKHDLYFRKEVIPYISDIAAVHNCGQKVHGYSDRAVMPIFLNRLADGFYLTTSDVIKFSTASFQLLSKTREHKNQYLYVVSSDSNVKMGKYRG